MTTPQAERQVGGDYRLEVKDFGPIAEASVDVRPLTVFIGPSNTGKSYLAILMYALHRCFDGFPRLMGRRTFQFREAMQPKASIRKSLTGWLSKVEAQGGSLPALPTDVAAHLRSRLEQAKGLDRLLEQEICRCFGAESPDDLIRRSSPHADTRIDLRIPQAADAQEVRYQLEFGQNSPRLSGQFPEIMSPPRIAPTEARDWLLETDQMLQGQENLFRLPTEARDRLLDTDTGEDDDEPDYLFIRFARSLFASLVQPLRQNAYYLPADRTGVMHSHQVVVSTLIQNATTAGLRPSHDVPMLSGVLADFLNYLISIGRRRPPHRNRLETALERGILNGTVRLDRTETGYPVFAYRPSGWEDDLPLMRASSMVSELAPVVLFLRHLVEPGDVLIIEEPEAHLHPAMQATFAQELARLVRSGVRIILTTHSEWFLEQIGNLVRLSGLPEGRRQDIAGIEDVDVALRPYEVGAWLFKPRKRPKGSLVEEVKLDPETGLYPTDYDKVSETLYNQSAMIFNRMQEGKGQ